MGLRCLSSNLCDLNLEHIMVEEPETTLIMRYVRKYVRRIRRQQRPMRYRWWRHHIISAAAVTVKKEQHLIRRRVLHLIISCFDHAMVNWRTLSNNWCLWRGGRNDVIRMGWWRQESVRVWWEKVYRKLCSPDGCKCKAQCCRQGILWMIHVVYSLSYSLESSRDMNLLNLRRALIVSIV